MFRKVILVAAFFCLSFSLSVIFGISKSTADIRPTQLSSFKQVQENRAFQAQRYPLQHIETVSDPSWQPGTIDLRTIPSSIGHSLPVRSVAFSPDSQFLASGSTDKTIKIWNLKAESLERTLAQNSSQINTIAFSPDGRFLASGGLDGTVRLWNWQSGQLLHTLSKHSNLVTSVAFSPNGQVLASGSGDKVIQIWDTQSGALRQKIVTKQFIQSIAFSPNGEILGSAGVERSVDLWNWETGDPIRSLGLYNSVIYSIAFSPDSQTIAFSPDALSPSASASQTKSEHNTIGIWNLQGQPVQQPFFSPSGRTLISGSSDQTVKIWNVQTGELIRDLAENDLRVLSIAYRPDGKAFAMGTGDGTIKLFISTE
jgi:WD40 repeat protein